MRLRRPHFLGIENISSDIYYSKDLGALATWDFSTIWQEEETSLGARENVIIYRVADAKLFDTT